MAVTKKTTGKKWEHKIVKSGNASVKIYQARHKTNKSGFTYTFRKKLPDGTTKNPKFADLNKAINEARIYCSRLAAGKVEGAEFSAAQRDEYLSAKKMVGETPLLSALQEWVKVKDLCGPNLIDAANAWSQANQSGLKTISLEKAKDAFIRDKKRSGVDVNSGYMRTLPRLLPNFAGRDIQSISATEVKNWLHTEFTQKNATSIHPSSFNSHLRRVKTFWTWARDEGHLPKNVQTAPEQVRRLNEQPLNIGILKVDEYRSILKLILKERKELLVVAVLVGLAGLRRAEVGGQKWKDIDLSRNLLKVSKAKKNTPAMRIVHLSPSAKKWLELCPQTDEMISSALGMDQLRKFLRENQFKLPENCFRHSFITYRVAKTGNVDETALESGNSRDVIFKHYRELVSKSQGQQWFNISP